MAGGNEIIIDLADRRATKSMRRVIEVHRAPRRRNCFGGPGLVVLRKGSTMLSPFVLEANRRSPASCASARLNAHASNAATIKLISSWKSSLNARVENSSSSKGRFSDFVELASLGEGGNCLGYPTT